MRTGRLYMISINELNEKNHKILERIKVFTYMIKDRAICDTNVTRDMFFDLTDRIKKQLDLEDRELYKEMLVHSDQTINDLANDFLSDSAEYKRSLKSYTKHWCYNKNLCIKNHEKFMQESNDIFATMQSRIVDVTENLYPVVSKIYNNR